MNSKLFFIVNAGVKKTKIWENSGNSLFNGSTKFNVMSQSINGNPFLPILLKVSIRGQPQMHLVGVSRFFPLFSEPPSHSSLADIAKKISKISFSNTQYEKCLNTKSSVKQIQDAQFHLSILPIHPVS